MRLAQNPEFIKTLLMMVEAAQQAVETVRIEDVDPEDPQTDEDVAEERAMGIADFIAEQLLEIEE